MQRPLARQTLTVCLLLRARQDLIASVVLAGPKLDSRQGRAKMSQSDCGATSQCEFPARPDGWILQRAADVDRRRQ
jgi:hypothetical protein